MVRHLCFSNLNRSIHFSLADYPASTLVLCSFSQLIEHEAMHLETLLYIALQCPSPTPLHAPPGFALPDFPSLARGWNAQVAADGPEERKRILVFDSREIVIGVDDDDEDREEVEWDEAHVVAWDVERELAFSFLSLFPSCDILPAFLLLHLLTLSLTCCLRHCRSISNSECRRFRNRRITDLQCRLSHLPAVLRRPTTPRSLPLFLAICRK